MNTHYLQLGVSSVYVGLLDEMKELANSMKNSRDKLEQYRGVIGHLRKRLFKAIGECNKQIVVIGGRVSFRPSIEIGRPDGSGDDDEIEIICNSGDLMKPLCIIYNSFIETGFESVADSHLLDIIRHLTMFGVSLLHLDIQDESTRHTLAIDAITKKMGLGSYAE